MSREIRLTVGEEGQRLDKLLSRELPELSRSALQSLIAKGCVTSGGKALSKSAKLPLGQEVTVLLPAPAPLEVEAQNIPLDIVYEDGDLLVVNKPKGIVVHPAPGNPDGTLVNALLYHCGDSLSGINGVIRPGIVHRIDKDTSGLIVAVSGVLSQDVTTRISSRIDGVLAFRIAVALSVVVPFAGSLAGTTRVTPCCSRKPALRAPVTVIWVLAWMGRSGKFLLINRSTP